MRKLGVTIGLLKNFGRAARQVNSVVGIGKVGSRKSAAETPLRKSIDPNESQLPCATQLHEDGHHDQGKDAGVMATLRTTVLTYCVWLSSAQFALEFRR